jgi:F0F1-type ATP synthase membrane subunit b/b'
MARSRELPKELQSLLHEYHLEMESAKRAIEEEYAEATDDARVKLHDHLESAVTTLGYLAREALSETVRARAAMFIVDKFIDQGAPNPEDPMQKLAEKLTKSGSAG